VGKVMERNTLVRKEEKLNGFDCGDEEKKNFN
jgi:hypothetical protein